MWYMVRICGKVGRRVFPYLVQGRVVSKITLMTQRYFRDNSA